MQKTTAALQGHVGEDATAEKAAGTGLYPNSYAAFIALIEAEIWTSQLASHGERLADQLQPFAGRRHLPYTPPPTTTDDPETRALIEANRKRMPAELKYLWAAADRWYEGERRTRIALEAAKIAVERAAAELDAPWSAPLERTSIAIKRALRDLSGAVPYAITASWDAGADPAVIAAMKSALAVVAQWREELRLLVQPEHTLAPPGTGTRSPGRPHRSKRRVRRPVLKERELDVMEALHVLGAVLDERARRTAPEIAKAAFGAENDGLVRELLAALKRKGMVGSKEGRGGGSWLTEKGLSRLHEARPETLRNSQ